MEQNSSNAGDVLINMPSDLSLSERMQEAELAWRQSETDIRRQELEQRIAEWTYTKENEKPDHSIWSRIAKNTGSSIAIMLSFITVIVGVVESSENLREEDKSQTRVAELNATAQQYGVVLDGYKSYLSLRDKAYNDAVTLDGKYVTDFSIVGDEGNTPLVKADQKAYSSVYNDELTEYTSGNSSSTSPVVVLNANEVGSAAQMLEFYMHYLEGPSDQQKYATQINSLWNQKDGNLGYNSSTGKFNDPSATLDTLDQHFKSAIANSIAAEADPTTYPSETVTLDKIITDPQFSK
jgi:hypothetical protein